MKTQFFICVLGLGLLFSSTVQATPADSLIYRVLFSGDTSQQQAFGVLDHLIKSPEIRFGLKEVHFKTVDVGMGMDTLPPSEKIQETLALTDEVLSVELLNIDRSMPLIRVGDGISEMPAFTVQVKFYSSVQVERVREIMKDLWDTDVSLVRKYANWIDLRVFTEDTSRLKNDLLALNEVVEVSEVN